MKTYANNPAVKYSDLNLDQQNDARRKVFSMHKSIPYPIDNSFEFFITSPTSVAVRKK